ncbi:MAG TPA: POTRA domain-containing protein, partial [Nitrospira sp.]|nr:POTRA domain-containing protein [Nitrospira sp.]
MKDCSIPRLRRASGISVLSILLLCGLPIAGHGEELPAAATDIAPETPSVTEPMSAPPADPVAKPALVEPSASPAPPVNETSPATSSETPSEAPSGAPVTDEPPAPATPPSQPLQEPPSAEPPTLPPPAVINGFMFSGNTVISQQQLEAVTRPFVGEVLDLPVLEKAAQSITDYYRKQGYTLALAYVPQQDVRLGVVTLAVLEGRIGDVTIIGNRHYSTEFLKRHFAKALAEPVTRNETLERALLILNDYPSLKTSATLESGKSAGATDVNVTVEDKRPLHFMLDMNNYGFNTISRYRFGAGVEVGNVLMDGATLTLNAIVGNHPDQLLFGMGNYSVPIGGQGTRIVLGGSQGKFDVDSQLSFFNMSGR